MFYFVVDTLELYYKRKLLNIANNRVESYISARFQCLGAKKISEDDIEKSEQIGWYKVRSQTNREIFYEVNTCIGVCTCIKGVDGSPCSHQAAVVLKYGDISCNTITTLSALARMNTAKLALGKTASEDLSFYTSIHQKSLQAKYGSEDKSIPIKEVQPMDTNDADNDDFEPSFSGSGWDLVRASVEEVKRENQAEDDVVDEYDRLCQGIDQVSTKLKELLCSRNPQLMSGVSRFLTKFDKLISSRRSESKLASCFHQFGWEMGTISSATAGQIRHGKRIPIQATAAGRRKLGKSRGK